MCRGQLRGVRPGHSHQHQRVPQHPDGQRPGWRHAARYGRCHHRGLDLSAGQHDHRWPDRSLVGGPGSDFNTSTNNDIFSNTVSGAEIGAFAGGAYWRSATLPGGLSIPSASGSAVSNTFSGNHWMGMTINTWDSSGWAGVSPPPRGIAEHLGAANVAPGAGQQQPLIRVPTGTRPWGPDFYGSVTRVRSSVGSGAEPLAGARPRVDQLRGPWRGTTGSARAWGR